MIKERLLWGLILSAPIISTWAQNNLKDARPEDIDLKTLDAVEVKTAARAELAGTSQQVKSWKREADGLWVKTTGGMLRLQPVSEGILRVTFGPEAIVRRHQPSPAVCRPPFAPNCKDRLKFSTTPMYESYMADVRNVHRRCTKLDSVPEMPDFHVLQDKINIYLKTETYRAEISRSDGHLALLTPDGRRLLTEAPGAARLNAATDSVCPYVRFALSADEALYGTGQFRDGRLNLRGCQRELVQFNTQAAIPVVYSTAGWGLFWDNYSRTVFNEHDGHMTLQSDYGNVVDYYIFVAKSIYSPPSQGGAGGGSLIDELISHYRTLTGHVPMLPRWALGYHQSRNRYHDRHELMGIAQRMQDEGIPMSSIFIDYHYWGRYGTGAMRFDEQLWPDLPSMLDSLHRVYDTHVVITQWPCFKPGTPNYERMAAKGYLLDGARAIDGIVYDVFNPEARREYRELISDLLRLGIDGWFLDGPEPDHMQSFLETQTAMGPAHRVRCLYPLLHIRNFHEALTEAVPDRRPYMLTRCAWAGQQRYGTAVWSGDIPSTLDELRRQIAAGLDFCATGQPYWTTDIGGYSGGDPSKPDYRETFARWFQYGTFCPIFRAHGRREPFDTTGPNELWAYGDTVQRICTDLVRLRCRMMPYVYSLTARVSRDDYTPMRLLAFDFADDPQVLDLRDEFMYGPAFLVCPVTEPGARSRRVYLPKGTRWIDYHTGRAYDGGQTLTADAPLERMPLYVRAGSIIPLTGDTIDVWPGADGDFTLYEDDGSTWAYRDGNYRETHFHWDNARSRLTISPSSTVGGDSVAPAALPAAQPPAPRSFTIRYRGEQTIIGSTHGRTEVNMHEFAPSRMEYFTWINNTNEGTTEAQTMANLDFFRWMNETHGLQLDLYAFDAGQVDGARFYGTTLSDRFRQKFPRGFGPVSQRAAAMGTRLGLWGGPDGFGNTPDDSEARKQMLVGLARDYHWGLFKFDAVCGPLRPEHAHDFADLMGRVRQYSPDLILLNHRLGLREAEDYATTFLWEGQESYIDVNIHNHQTAPHHRAGAMARGLVPGMQRLTEDHGVCLSSCLDGWDDELVLHVFGRCLILAPELYGNPWLLRDDELARLARLCNLHRRHAQLLVDGFQLPPERYGDFAVSRGDSTTRFIVLRNLSWQPKTVGMLLGAELGLAPTDSISLVEYHPEECFLGAHAYGATVPVTIPPFRALLLAAGQIGNRPLRSGLTDVSCFAEQVLQPCDVPSDAEALYEATCFAADNNALEVRSLLRSGPTAIPEVQAARDAFFSQRAFIERGCWDRNLFDGDLQTGFFPSQRRGDQRVRGGCLRLDLGEVLRVDSIRLHVPSCFGLQPMLPEEGQTCTVSTDLRHWQTLTFLSDTLMVIPVSAAMRYLRLPGAPAQLCEVEVFADGHRLPADRFRASNLFAPSQPCVKAWSARITLPASGRLCVALEGQHGAEGAYAALRLNDGRLVGAPDRAPSYPANVWENAVVRADSHYTYYFPITPDLAGLEAEVVVMANNKDYTDFQPTVRWLIEHKKPNY